MLSDQMIQGIIFPNGLEMAGVEGKKIKKFLKWKNKQQAPAEDDPEQLGENPCGFCRWDGALQIC